MRPPRFLIAVQLTNLLSRLVFVRDPTDSEIIPVGKQTKNPSHIFYRSCSGIWQSVWIETTPSDRITQLDLAAAADGTGMWPRLNTLESKSIR